MSIPEDEPYPLLEDYVSEDEEDTGSISTTGTDIEGDLRVERLFPPETCRVIFEHAPTRTLRVCGNPGAKCQRKGHKPIDENVSQGSPGYYREVPGLRERSVPDGDATTYRDAVEVDLELATQRAADREMMDDTVASPEFKGEAAQALPTSPESDTSEYSDEFLKIKPELKKEPATPAATFKRLLSTTAAEAIRSLNRPFDAEAKADMSKVQTLDQGTTVPTAKAKVQPSPSILKKAPRHSNVVPDQSKVTLTTTKSQRKAAKTIPPLNTGSTSATEADKSLAATILVALEEERKQRRLLEEKVANWMSGQTNLKEEAKKVAAREKAAEKALKKAEAQEAAKQKEASNDTGDGLRELKQLVAEMTAALKNQSAQAAAALTEPPPPTTQAVEPTRNATGAPRSTNDVPPPKIIRYPTAPDTSTGDKKVFEVDVQVAPHKVLQELCPSGIPQDAMQALGESLPDTGAMPGTYGISSGAGDAGLETETFANQMGMMLLHLRAGSQGSGGTIDYGVTMDTQWSSASRTQLRANMSEAKFDLLFTSFNAMESEYGNVFKANVAGVLSFLPWLDPEMVTMYVAAGRLAQVFTTAMTNYRRLLEFIDKSRRKNSWAYASIILNHYALKLHVIRSGSTKRLVMILRTYILLREGAAAEWMGMSVQGKILAAASSTTLGLSDESETNNSSPTTTTPSTPCDHCHVKHLGGASRCPFKSTKVPAADARRLAQTVAGTQTTKAWLSRAYKVAKESLDSAPPADKEK